MGSRITCFYLMAMRKSKKEIIFSLVGEKLVIEGAMGRILLFLLMSRI